MSVCLCVCVCTYIRMGVCVYVRVLPRSCMRACVCECVCVCLQVRERGDVGEDVLVELRDVVAMERAERQQQLGFRGQVGVPLK